MYKPYGVSNISCCQMKGLLFEYQDLSLHCNTLFSFVRDDISVKCLEKFHNVFGVHLISSNKDS
jgi:hypothetical protein